MQQLEGRRPRHDKGKAVEVTESWHSVSNSHDGALSVINLGSSDRYQQESKLVEEYFVIKMVETQKYFLLPLQRNGESS